MNRWELYALLKKERTLQAENIINLIKSMSLEELSEGVIEYLLAKKTNDRG
jgi:hypothetical protein